MILQFQLRKRFLRPELYDKNHGLFPYKSATYTALLLYESYYYMNLLRMKLEHQGRFEPLANDKNLSARGKPKRRKTR